MRLRPPRPPLSRWRAARGAPSKAAGWYSPVPFFGTWRVRNLPTPPLPLPPRRRQCFCVAPDRFRPQASLYPPPHPLNAVEPSPFPRQPAPIPPPPSRNHPQDTVAARLSASALCRHGAPVRGRRREGHHPPGLPVAPPATAARRRSAGERSSPAPPPPKRQGRSHPRPTTGKDAAGGHGSSSGRRVPADDIPLGALDGISPADAATAAAAHLRLAPAGPQGRQRACGAA